MRIDKVITKGENALIFYQILPTNSLRKCMEISSENLYVDTWGLRLRRQGDGALAGKLLAYFFLVLFFSL